MSPSDKPGAIFKAIQSIKLDIKFIGKERQNKIQNYSFRGIDDLYNALHEPMSKHGVFSVPTVLSEHREERPTKAGGVMIYTTLKVQYRFYATDGSHFDSVVIGEASDSGDKSSNKAMSAAHKYALIQVFDIPTNEDNDTENNSPEFKPKTSGQKNVAKPTSKPAPKATQPAKITADQQRFIFALRDELALEPEKAKEVLKSFGYAKSSEIKAADFDKIVASMRALKPKEEPKKEVEDYDDIPL